jgi:hypothetical protein
MRGERAVSINTSYREKQTLKYNVILKYEIRETKYFHKEIENDMCGCYKSTLYCIRVW